MITKTYDLILWSCKHTSRFPRNHRFEHTRTGIAAACHHAGALKPPALSVSGRERMVNGWAAASGEKRRDLSEEIAWFGNMPNFGDILNMDNETTRGYYPGGKEGHIPTRSASEGSGAFPSLARRVNMQQHAELPCRGNKNADYRGGVTCLDDTQLLDACLHASESGGRSRPEAVRGMPEVPIAPQPPGPRRGGRVSAWSAQPLSTGVCGRVC